MEDYDGHICLDRRELSDDLTYHQVNKATDGSRFTKFYLLQTSTKGTLYKDTVRNRYMLQLDEPLVALNEEDAPFKSKLYRLFLTEEELIMWDKLPATSLH